MRFIKFLVKKILILKWLLSLKWGRYIFLDTDKKATVVLLSYKRVKNIEPITRSFLKCNFIEKVVISNHNPEIKIEEWVKLKDERVILINQPKKRRCGYRWVIAQDEPADYFIAVDDDAFIYPEQIRKLFLFLIEEPKIPHGVKGSTCFDEEQNFVNLYFQQQNREVHVLHQIYFVTREHVKNYFKYLEQIKRNNPVVGEYVNPLEVDSVGDDIVISHTGSSQAKIHDVGFILTCLTQYSEGIAIKSEKDFGKKRIPILKEVKKVSI